MNKPLPCPTCSGVTTCPGPGWLTAETAGLPADWKPPLRRLWGGQKGPRDLDEVALRQQLPPGISWALFGTAGSHRVQDHGGQTWWVSQCTYLALRRANQT